MFKKPATLCLLSGVLLSAGYYPFGHGLIMLLAFVPLLLAEDYFVKNKNRYRPGKVFVLSSITFATWYLLTMWWVYNASAAGMVIAVLVGTVLMAGAFTLFHIVRRNLGNSPGYLALILFWLSFEYFFINAEISNPWLTLGYGFQYNIKLIQWYEFTGALGGSFWVLLINILMYRLYQTFLEKKNAKPLLVVFSALLLIPIVVSIIMFHNYKEKENPYEIIVVQPNIDPYLKFNDIPSLEQTQILIDLASEHITDSTDYIVAPETCISNNIWLNKLKQVPDIQAIYNFLDDYPGVKYVLGIMAYDRYTPLEKTITSKPLGSTGYYYDSFNSAIQLDSTDYIPVYHKSQLVVGVEKMPYPGLLKFLKPLTLRLGGIFRSHGTQTERDNFIAPGCAPGWECYRQSG